MQERTALPIIAAVSAMVLLLVPVLLALPPGELDINVRMLPKLNAGINSMVSVVLVAGLVCIKRGQVRLHKLCMLTAFLLSTVFLLSYVLYHYQAQETRFGGVGSIRYVYFFILITHIVLAAAIVPLSLLTMYRALNDEIAKHKKLARYTWPIWFYVSVTGVILYFMISPYYPV